MNALISRTLLMLTLSVFSQASNYDNRIPANPNEFPAVGRLYAEIDGNQIQESDLFEKDLNKTIQTSKNLNKLIQYNFCTATLLPENLILTAAHCYEQLSNYNSVKIRTYFQPSLVGSKPVLVTAKGMTWKLGKVFNREFLKDDWAVIRLHQKIPNITPLRFFQVKEDDKKEISVEMVGYPLTVKNEKPMGFTMFKNQCRYMNHINFNQVLDKKTLDRMLGSDVLDCVASLGNSGGPLIYQLKVNNTIEDVIVGITVADYQRGLFSKLLGKKQSPITFATPINEILAALLK